MKYMQVESTDYPGLERHETKVETCPRYLSNYNPKNRVRARRHETQQCKPGKVARSKEQN
jgi:hypothetical protein